MNRERIRLVNVALLGVCLTAGLAGAQDRTAHSRTLPGLVMPQRQVALSAPLEGVLQALTVKEGDLVRAGQVIGTLDDRIASAAVAAAKSVADRQAEQDYARAELMHARQKYTRLSAAMRTGAMTATAVEEAKARVDQAKASLASAVEAKVQAERNLDLEQARLNRHRIVAPFDGEITRVMASIGATLTPTQELAMLVALETLQAELFLPQARFGSLQTGKDYALVAGAPVNRRLSGKLTYVDPVLDPATRTFRCLFSINNGDRKLPAGFTVELELE